MIKKLFALSCLLLVFSSCTRGVDVQEYKDFSYLDYNFFHEESGLFSFSYRNAYELKKEDSIYFLENLSNGNLIFQIFLDNGKFDYDNDQFECIEKNDKRLCFSKNYKEGAVENLELFPGEDKDKYVFFTRTDALKHILDLSHPNLEFSDYADHCFYDISVETKNSGYICFAKEHGLVQGISGNFYPESGINLWGTLKLLFLAFDKNYTDFEEKYLTDDMFDKMTRYHFAYDLIAKAYYEGIILNPSAENFWPNRVLYKGEFLDIVERFLKWQSSTTLKDYTASNAIINLEWKKEPEIEEKKIYIYGGLENFKFDEKAADDFDLEDIDEKYIKDVYSLNKGNDTVLFFKSAPYIYNYILTLKSQQSEDIDKIYFEYKKERLKAKLYIEYKDSSKRYFKLDIDNDFEKFSLLDEAEIKDKNITPNSISPYKGDIKRFNVYMLEDDFDDILENQTVEKRYPGFLEIIETDGSQERNSIVLKTRGNASLGYIKPSFTIESFKDFSDGTDEIKLRSLISDDTLIREKIIYSLFEDLGYVAPRFSEAMLELNKIPFGLYQPTEAIKDDFFEKRGLNVKNYYYARNITSPYLANLSLLDSMDIYTTHYDAKGDGEIEKLISFIEEIDQNQSSIIEKINLQNIFDYAAITYFFTLNDSYTHNYYLYIDESTEEWNIFFWDVDAGIEYVPEITKDALRAFMADSSTWSNKLFNFLESSLTDQQFDTLLKNFKSNYIKNSHILEDLSSYSSSLKEAISYDNNLWNGVYLERKQKWIDSISEIEILQEHLKEIDKKIRAL